MMRPLEEVVASQNRMLERMGKEVPRTPTGAVITAFQKHLKEVDGWLANKPYLRVLRVNHADVVAQPREAAERIAEFVGAPLSIEKMAAQVERSLYRERAGFMSPAACLEILRNQLNCEEGCSGEAGVVSAESRGCRERARRIRWRDSSV